MSSIMYNIKCLHPLLIFFIFEPPYLALKTSNISHSLVGNKIVDHSDVVEALPVGAAPTTSSFSS